MDYTYCQKTNNIKKNHAGKKMCFFYINVLLLMFWSVGTYRILKCMYKPGLNYNYCQIILKQCAIFNLKICNQLKK